MVFSPFPALARAALPCAALPAFSSSPALARAALPRATPQEIPTAATSSVTP